MATKTNTGNTFNLLYGAFLSADQEIVPLVQPIAIRLLNAKGSKIADRKLMQSKDGKYYQAQLTDPNGQTVWAMIPINYPLLKWSNNTAWVLLKPEPVTMTEAEFEAL